MDLMLWKTVKEREKQKLPNFFERQQSATFTLKCWNLVSVKSSTFFVLFCLVFSIYNIIHMFPPFRKKQIYKNILISYQRLFLISSQGWLICYSFAVNNRMLRFAPTNGKAWFIWANYVLQLALTNRNPWFEPHQPWGRVGCCVIQKQLKPAHSGPAEEG